MNTLVTGGNGFIGRAIVEHLLARGDSVRVLGRGHYPALAALGVRCIQADLADAPLAELASALRGCDVVFHVAAKAGVWGAGSDYYRNNVTATQRLVYAAIQAGVPNLVFTSSPSVAFGNQPVEGANEQLPYPRHFLSHYQHTKALAEQFVLRQRAIRVVAIRPPLVFGPRDPHLVPRLIARARAGRLVQVGNGENLIDVTYIDNAAHAHLLAADALAAGTPVCGKVYLIGQEQPVNLWQFVNDLLARVGAPPVTRRVSLPVALRLAGALEAAYRLAGTAHEPPLTRLTVTQLAVSRWFDKRAAARDLGYTPLVHTEEALRRTALGFGAGVKS